MDLEGKVMDDYDPDWQATATETEEIVPIVRTLASVPREPIRWLWPGYVPRACVSVLDGDPGQGKSSISIDLAARMSRGWTMPPAAGPCEGAEPEDVLILSAEDDPGTTILPRLLAAGGDPERVHLLDGVMVGDRERPAVLPLDLDMVESIVRERSVALVVIDPFMAFLDSETDSHRDQDVRLVLHRLGKLAAATDAGILLIRHLNKYRSGDAIYRGGGSIGIIGAARSGLLVGKHPDRPGSYVLAGVKSNLGPMPPSLEYTMEPTDDVARIAWGGVVDIAADELVAPRRADKSADAKAESRDRQDKADDAAVLVALDRLDPKRQGAGYTKLRDESRLSRSRWTRAETRLKDDGFIRECQITITAGKGAKRTCKGLVRGSWGSSGSSGQPDDTQDQDHRCALPL
jgi:hypothetical protein